MKTIQLGPTGFNIREERVLRGGPAASSSSGRPLRHLECEKQLEYSHRVEENTTEMILIKYDLTYSEASPGVNILGHSHATCGYS